MYIVWHIGLSEGELLLDHRVSPRSYVDDESVVDHRASIAVPHGDLCEGGEAVYLGDEAGVLLEGTDEAG